MGLIVTKLEETIYHSIAMSVLVLNWRRIQLAFLRFLINWLSITSANSKITFVQ